MLPVSVSNPFQALFKNATVGILVVERGGAIIMANDFVLHMLGYREHELLHQPLEVLIPPAFRARHRKNLKKYFERPRPKAMRQLELKALTAQGREIPVEISLGFYRVKGKDCAIAVINDISEKKIQETRLRHLAENLEQQVKERTAALTHTVRMLREKMATISRTDESLKQTNRFLQSLLNHAGTMIIATDADGIVNIFNPKAEALLGYEAGEVIGRYSLVHFVCPDERASRLAELTDAEKNLETSEFLGLVNRARAGHVEETEWRMRRRNGTSFPVSITISGLFDDDGRLTGYLGVAVDITERKNYLTSLQSALKREQQLGELKSRFVSMASHEFRTPLSTILSSVYLLGKYKETGEQPKREKHIHRIEQSINLLNDILNDFLSLGRIEEGRLEVKWSLFDVKDLITGAISESQLLLKPGQYVEYDHTGNPTVLLDPALLKHIFLNLFSNAVKFSPDNSSIRIYTRVEASVMLFEIADEGIGIPEADQPHIFSRFFRAGNAENIKGTGLGLHIVAKYAEMLNGRIGFQSVPGKGTRFTITFKLPVES